MSAKQTKKNNKQGLLSFIFRNTSKSKPKKNDYIQLVTKTPILKYNENEKDIEILEKYYTEESIMSNIDSLEDVVALKKSHIGRLSQEKSCTSDMDSIIINSGDTLLFTIIQRWGKHIKNSIENLDETLELFYGENAEPTACFHLNRSIVHLVNLYETLSEISKLTPELYDIQMYGYLNIIRTCISHFRSDFIKYCREVNNYISEFKQTLTLLINRHPENRLVIHAMGDIEKLYNCALEFTNNIITNTPDELNSAISYIDKISNDINDIKSDLINVKHHQDKDIKYVTSSYA
jgi:hypothetical protein